MPVTRTVVDGLDELVVTRPVMTLGVGFARVASGVTVTMYAVAGFPIAGGAVQVTLILVLLVRVTTGAKSIELGGPVTTVTVLVAAGPVPTLLVAVTVNV